LAFGFNGREAALDGDDLRAVEKLITIVVRVPVVLEIVSRSVGPLITLDETEIGEFAQWGLTTGTLLMSNPVGSGFAGAGGAAGAPVGFG